MKCRHYHNDYNHTNVLIFVHSLNVLYNNNNTTLSKMTADQKDTYQYIGALFTLFSGIVMCFLSFFMNNYIIHDSALWYFGETCVFAGGIFGVSLYIRGEVQRINTKIDKLLK